MLPYKKTVVIGASNNPERYSYLATQQLAQKGYEVIAIGSKTTQIGTTPVITHHPAIENVHTVTLYINPQLQKDYYQYILSLHPQRIIFNPGAENSELYHLAKANQITPINACTLVLLSTGQY